MYYQILSLYAVFCVANYRGVGVKIGPAGPPSGATTHHPDRVQTPTDVAPCKPIGAKIPGCVGLKNGSVPGICR